MKTSFSSSDRVQLFTEQNIMDSYSKDAKSRSAQNFKNLSSKKYNRINFKLGIVCEIPKR